MVPSIFSIPCIFLFVLCIPSSPFLQLFVSVYLDSIPFFLLVLFVCSNMYAVPFSSFVYYAGVYFISSSCTFVLVHFVLFHPTFEYLHLRQFCILVVIVVVVSVVSLCFSIFFAIYVRLPFRPFPCKLHFDAP
mmetsp:Transcript_8134/g.12566  ORF Transcript_8134/g.12566 Transcript_8134/m.12566 type:complete len:133 (-) Transcript_8134:127-525(-)